MIGDKSGAVLCVAATGACWGLMAAVVQAIAWDAVATAAARASAGALLLLLWLVWRRKATFSAPSMQFLVAVAYAMCTTSYTLSCRLTEVSRAASLFYVFPVVCVVLESVLLQRRPSRQELALLVIGTSGVFLMFGRSLLSGEILYGDLLALLSGIAWAVCAVVQRQIDSPAANETALAAGVVMSALALVPAALMRELSGVTGGQTLGFIALGLLTFAPLVLYASGAGQLSVTTSSVLLALELPTAVLCGVIWFNDQPSAVSWIGMALITLNAVAASLLSRKSS